MEELQPVLSAIFITIVFGQSGIINAAQNIEGIMLIRSVNFQESIQRNFKRFRK